MKIYITLLLVATLIIFSTAGCTEQPPANLGDNQAGDNNIPSNSTDLGTNDTGDGITGGVTESINDAGILNKDLTDPELDDLSDDLKEIDW